MIIRMMDLQVLLLDFTRALVCGVVMTIGHVTLSCIVVGLVDLVSGAVMVVIGMDFPFPKKKKWLLFPRRRMT